MHRHEFLARMHEIIKPKVYLETGVQTGASLALAKAAEVAIGIDPIPMIGASGNQAIFEMYSDDYFSPSFDPFRIKRAIDFAFIDGGHTYDQALRDFFHIQAHGHRRTIVAFDDVLPFAPEVGAREFQGTHHWAGDVWRAEEHLVSLQPNLTLVLVNLDPTGLLLAWDLDPSFEGWDHGGQRLLDLSAIPVPEHVLDRRFAVTAEFALKLLTEKVEGA